jgi:hydroxymethylglutaryl-CoA reductase
VVAAIARAAKIWSARGGFKASALGTQKKGQVHFFWGGTKAELDRIWAGLKDELILSSNPLTKNMEARGGGITGIRILDKTLEIQDYYQLDVDFETGEAMGANFINSVLENMASELREFLSSHFPKKNPPKILMSILSNETPECLAEAVVECPVEQLDGVVKGIPADEFAWSFEKAVQISKFDRARAVTHNKGIFNGIDALALAMGNDWRALEAAGHNYAMYNGKYQGLTDVSSENGLFRFSLKIPVNIGVVGGITSIHPLVKFAMKILQNPSAKELMQLFAVAGLASNFSALAALVGNGIQAGHMKLHLQNILAQLGASESQSAKAKEYFSGRAVSFSAVRTYLNSSE